MNKWIPITTRLMTADEIRELSESTGFDVEDLENWVYTCPLPESGQMVIVTTRWNCVSISTFYNDQNGCCFEDYEDLGDVKAWMPLPEPYKEENDGR